jgi:hypothetical protein
VFAVEVEDAFTLGAPMSPPVEAALEEVVLRVEAWLSPMLGPCDGSPSRSSRSPS